MGIPSNSQMGDHQAEWRGQTSQLSTEGKVLRRWTAWREIRSGGVHRKHCWRWKIDTIGCYNDEDDD